MIQTMIMGADVDVAEWEGGKAILVTHPMGHQFVIPVDSSEAMHVATKLRGDIVVAGGPVPPIAEAA